MVIILDSRAISSVWEKEEKFSSGSWKKGSDSVSSKATKQCKHPSKIVDFRFWDVQVDGIDSYDEASSAVRSLSYYFSAVI